MSAVAAAALFVLPALVRAQDQSSFPETPLASKTFAYPDGIPYQADTDTNLIRGTQAGYNLCNSTTEGDSSMCQTSFLNALDDFCLWAPSEKDSMIADTEGEEVAWCTKPGRGTRIIPDGALQGVQFMRTPDYVQVVGFIDQSKINIQTDDFGGELDPHGADLRGNPMGGLVYSTAWSDSNDSYTQVIEWHNFMGGNAFCFKVCDPSKEHAADYCQHIYDRVGCAYNAPNNAQNGTFESCEGDNQMFPGVYTGDDGQTTTWTQPPESEGAIATMPFTPSVPASSNCQTFSSSELFASASSGASGSGSGGSGSGASGSGSDAAATGSNAASALRVSEGQSVAWMGVMWATVAVAMGGVAVFA
ncbi:hypothetical protein BD626DRAFT_391411 [Schizophyllum amplum]|uniref:Macrofage activating glycoprotein n=1 Tax=Schizophyllum amplum TaxID=97359 RepID=A0A550CZM5_9AGAR|nr:hypothetical protein BD626DRAFT_391411 [Auriculariopsis ampla]